MSTIQKIINGEKIQLFKQNKLAFEYISFFTIGFFATGSVFNDYKLTFLFLLLAFSSKSKSESLCIAVGALVASGYLSMSDSFYLPFFLSAIAYITVYSVLNSHSYSKIAALVFLSVGKILFVYFYLDVWYKLSAILQSALIFYLSELASQGREDIVKRNSYKTFQSQLSVLVICAGYILSFSGGALVYWSMAVSICLLWLSIKLYRTDLIFVFIFFMAVCVADRLNFIYLICLFSVSAMAGGLFVERNEKLFYIAPALISLSINLAFMGQFVGFAPFITVLTAQILYIVLPHIFAFKQISPVSLLYKSGKDYRQLAQNMEKLTDSLNYLANCAVDISKLNDNLVKKDNLCDMVSEEICLGCGKNMYCWVDKFSFTNEQFLLLQKATERNKQAELAPAFYSQCEKADKVFTSFEENNRALVSKRYISLSQKKYMKILQETILSISSAVAGILSKSNQATLVNTLCTQQMQDFLAELKIMCTYCLCTSDPDKITFSAVDKVSEENLFKICEKADEIYSKTFTSPVVSKQGGEYVYTILCLPALKFEYSAKSRALVGVNGDRATMFSNGEKLFCILSDGMGTGYTAAGESSTASAMLKSLLLADVEIENALSITNIALNLRGGESGATADVLSVNLYSGDVELYKAGAGETLILSDREEKRFYGESLPLGIVKDAKIKAFSAKVSSEDVIIMCTDGIGIVSEDIVSMSGEGCKDIALNIINASTNADDKTVVVIKMKSCT